MQDNSVDQEVAGVNDEVNSNLSHGLASMIEDSVTQRSCQNLLLEELQETTTGETKFDQELVAVEDNLSGNLVDNQPVRNAIKGVKGKKKRKTLNDILGFSRVNPQNQYGGRNKQKCIVFRSAVAAAALSASISSNEIANRNRILLSEAQAIWEVNKTMGLGYDGDEEEVVSKIADDLALDKERVEF